MVQYLPVGAETSTIRLMESQHGTTTCRALTEHRSEVNRLVFSPDGQEPLLAGSLGQESFAYGIHGHRYTQKRHSQIREVGSNADGVQLRTGGTLTIGNRGIALWDTGDRSIQRAPR